MLSRTSSLSKREQPSPEIESVLKLKLVANNNQNMKAKGFHQPSHSIINTPSTIENTKKFKSCELYRKQDQFSCLKNKGQNIVFNRSKISESTTRILTINQIRKHEQLIKQKQESKQRLRSSSSRKIFVSLSKKNSAYREKPKQDIDLIPADSVLRDQVLLPTNQKIKINVYRNIAKTRNL